MKVQCEINDNGVNSDEHARKRGIQLHSHRTGGRFSRISEAVFATLLQKTHLAASSNIEKIRRFDSF